MISTHSSLIIEKCPTIKGQLEMRQSRIFSVNVPDPISDPTLDGDRCRVRNGQTNAQMSRWLPLELALQNRKADCDYLEGEKENTTYI